MDLTKRKMILPLVFILIIISLLRVLKLSITTSSFPSPRLTLNAVNYEHFKVPHIAPLSPMKDSLTKKEIRFLFDIITHKSPCNILVFAIEDEYMKLPIVNKGGNTVFLENRPEKINKMKTRLLNATQVYKVEYNTHAKDAYELLKHARSNSSCYLNSGIRSILTKCKLALTGLPEEVVETKWDVIIVDGPDGDGPDSPGRMGSIFMASVLARAGNETNVVVHDVDRMIEKWFAWEFLCEENRVASKGRFWNFRIPRKINNSSSEFCST